MARRIATGSCGRRGAPSPADDARAAPAQWSLGALHQIRFAHALDDDRGPRLLAATTPTAAMANT
jgi:hypothetical protein